MISLIPRHDFKIKTKNRNSNRNDIPVLIIMESAKIINTLFPLISIQIVLLIYITT